MTWLAIRPSSLLDTVNRWPVEWWLVYSNTERHHWWNRWLQPGFQHVQAVRRDGQVWLWFKPHAEFLDVDIIRGDQTPWAMFPGATIQRVQALREEGRMRSRFHLGPVTCVELVKALLGIRAVDVRTPWQLYRHCRGKYEQRGQAV